MIVKIEVCIGDANGNPLKGINLFDTHKDGFCDESAALEHLKRYTHAQTILPVGSAIQPNALIENAEGHYFHQHKTSKRHTMIYRIVESKGFDCD